jgi:hypothetical protein
VSEKPHKGVIRDWIRLPFVEHGLGYCILGTPGDQPDYTIRTSYVVAHDEETGEVETRNSRYTLK